MVTSQRGINFFLVAWLAYRETGCRQNERWLRWRRGSGFLTKRRARWEGIAGCWCNNLASCRCRKNPSFRAKTNEIRSLAALTRFNTRDSSQHRFKSFLCSCRCWCLQPGPCPFDQITGCAHVAAPLDYKRWVLTKHLLKTEPKYTALLYQMALHCFIIEKLYHWYMPICQYAKQFNRQPPKTLTSPKNSTIFHTQVSKILSFFLSW